MSFKNDIESLAELIFLKNTNDNFIYLTLDGIDTSEQLFTIFCLLLTKGIFLLYGEGVNLETIPSNILQDIFKKMHFAGIECKIDILEKPITAPVGIFHIFNNQSNNVKDHALHIIVSKLYVLRFGLAYRTNKNCKYKFMA